MGSPVRKQVIREWEDEDAGHYFYGASKTQRGDLGFFIRRLPHGVMKRERQAFLDELPPEFCSAYKNPPPEGELTLTCI